MENKPRRIVLLENLRNNNYKLPKNDYPKNLEKTLTGKTDQVNHYKNAVLVAAVQDGTTLTRKNIETGTGDFIFCPQSTFRINEMNFYRLSGYYKQDTHW